MRHMKSCLFLRPFTYRKSKPKVTRGEVRYSPIPRTQAKIITSEREIEAKTPILGGKGRKPLQFQDPTPTQSRGCCWLKHRVLFPIQDLYCYKTEIGCHGLQGGARMLRRPQPQHSAEEGMSKMGAELGKSRTPLFPSWTEHWTLKPLLGEGQECGETSPWICWYAGTTESWG